MGGGGQSDSGLAWSLVQNASRWLGNLLMATNVSKLSLPQQMQLYPCLTLLWFLWPCTQQCVWGLRVRCCPPHPKEALLWRAEPCVRCGGEWGIRRSPWGVHAGTCSSAVAAWVHPPLCSPAVSIIPFLPPLLQLLKEITMPLWAGNQQSEGYSNLL